MDRDRDHRRPRWTFPRFHWPRDDISPTQAAARDGRTVADDRHMRTTILTAGVLIMAATALSSAQDGSPRQRWPDDADRGGQSRPAGGDGAGSSQAGGGERGSARRAEPRDRQGGEEASRPRDLPRRRGADLADQERERARAAEPRLRRPEDGPRVAVPRPAPPPRVGPGRYAPPARRYDSRWYPQRYGSYRTGPSYFFYADPFYRYPDRSFAWYGDAGGYGFGYPTGELRLEVRPQYAEVYVDGYYAGLVDDFDGFAQGLRLEGGPYHIEIVAAGYEPVELDVRIQPGRRISFERDLLPER